MKKIKLALGLMILPFIGVSQSSTATNTQNNPQTRYLGFDNNFPCFVRTNNIPRAQFTTGASLSSITSDFGDGLRILAPAGNSGNLDLFTSGQNNRFEILSTNYSFPLTY